MRSATQRTRPKFTRLSHRRRQKQLSYVLLFVSAGVAFVVLLAFLSQNKSYLIRSITVEGNKLIPAEPLTATADTVLAGSYLWLFPHRNSLIYPSGAVAAAVTAAFPAVESVSVRRSAWDRITLSVHERTPAALWCSGTETASSAAGCDFLDGNGFIFAQAPDYSPGAYLRFSGTFATSTIPGIGTQLMPPQRYKELSYFLKSLSPLGLTAQTVDILKDGSGIVDYDITIEGGGHLLVSGTRSLEDTLSDITAFFRSPDIASSSSQFMGRMQYVDFRFAGKVYYKPLSK